MCIYLRVIYDFHIFADRKPDCVKFSFNRDEQLDILHEKWLYFSFPFPFHINNRLNIISKKYIPNNNYGSFINR